MLIVAAAGATMIMTASPAAAHAVLEGSVPASGARVESLDAIELQLSETPDLDLSSVELLATDGATIPLGSLERGGRAQDLEAAILDPLDPGTYLVTWRAFSAVDGHVTAGAFAFGFQADPEAIAVPEATSPGVTSLSVIGRALFLLGLALAFGSAIIELLGPLAVRALPLLAAAGAATGLLGVAILGHQQRLDSGASASAFLATPIGRAVLWRAAGLAAAVVFALAWRRWMRQRRIVAPLVAASVVAAAIAHVMNGHAGVGGRLQITLQVIHVLAIGAWVGGFVPLLAAIRRGNPRRIVTRFSTMALILVPIVIVTGQVRAFDELPSIDAFWASSYGRVLIAKWIVLLGILAFAAKNRRAHVARVSEDPEPLQRAVRAEAMFGVIVFGLAALLANLAPRSAAAQDGSADRIAVTRTSFAGDLEATLIAEPGTPGPARLVLELVTLPEREPVDDAEVQLRLRYRGRAGVEPVTIELTAEAPGRFTGDAVLTPAGPFEAALLVQRATGSTEVILPLATLTAQQLVEQGAAPTISSITFDDGSSVQVYLDPETAGASEFHATYFDASGTEQPIEDVVIVASGPDSVRPLVVRSLTPGHVVADAFLGTGTWRFDVSAMTLAGELRSAWVVREVA